jgi:hypothetical protein
VQKSVNFRGWQCRVEKRSYGGSDRIALVLYEAVPSPDDNSPVAVATVHVPELALAADEVVIKDYSENEGMLDTLVAAGLVSASLHEVQSGYVTLYICRCLL